MAPARDRFLAALLAVFLVGCGGGPAAAPEITSLPLPWPLPLPTGDQVAEARACSLEESVVAERYPESVEAGGLRERYPVASACDWAVLAVAYAARAEAAADTLREGQIAWANAVSQNVAYAFKEELFAAYVEAPDAVAAPAFATKPLSRIRMEYSWGGLGDSVAYDITIADGDTAPHAEGQVDGRPYSGTLGVDTAQALGEALTGLFPVANASGIVVCYDNYPDWRIVLTYQGGREVVLTTEGSNVYGLGGPWWAQIDGRLYFQYSSTIVRAVHGIVQALELPVGEPMATYCSGMKTALLDVLYSEQEEAP